MPENEKKIEKLFLLSNALNVYSLEVPRHFIMWTLDIVQKSFWISHYFDTKKICVKIYYSSKSILSDFGIFCSKIHIRKYVKHFSTWRLNIVQNVLILSSTKILQEGKMCQYSPNLYTTDVHHFLLSLCTPSK